MDIDIHTAKPGDKVVVTEKTKTSGWPSDSANVERYLEVGQPYEIEHVEIHSWHTRLYLRNQPRGIYFNSVNFEVWEE